MWNVTSVPFGRPLTDGVCMVKVWVGGPILVVEAACFRSSSGSLVCWMVDRSGWWGLLMVGPLGLFVGGWVVVWMSGAGVFGRGMENSWQKRCWTVAM